MSDSPPLPTWRDFRFFHRLRVRWAEVDMQHIVFNAHYLMYLDTAVADYWRELALPYYPSMHRLGGDLYVVKSSLTYKGSARYDEALEVGLRCTRLGNSSMVLTGGIFRDRQLLVAGELVYVFADPTTQTSKPMPDALKAIFMGHDQGQAMTELQLGPWDQVRPLASELRMEVFVQEQKVPADLELDDQDAHCVHALVTNRLGMPVATGRLLPADQGVSRIGRMAVTQPLRGTGLGRSVLQALIHAAGQRGDRRVILHAQRTAEGFYERNGFVAEGEPFVEAGIDHITMGRTL
jgi:YbgC/YbaW family acyl-CoA thioester hydrolase